MTEHLDSEDLLAVLSASTDPRGQALSRQLSDGSNAASYQVHDHGAQALRRNWEFKFREAGFGHVVDGLDECLAVLDELTKVKAIAIEMSVATCVVLLSNDLATALGVLKWTKK